MLDSELKVHYEAIDKLEKIYEEKGFDSRGAVSIYNYYDINKKTLPEDLISRLEVLLKKLDHLIAPELERLRGIVDGKLKEYGGILNGTLGEQIKAYVDLGVFSGKLDPNTPPSVYKPLADLREEISKAFGSDYNWYKDVVDFRFGIESVVRMFSGVDSRNVEQVEKRVNELKLLGKTKLMYEEGCKMLDELMEHVKRNVK